MSEPSIYTVGGTVQAGSGVYLSRQADQELLALCRERTFAYILTARQLGKSSLMVRTAEQLAEEGIQSVRIDLSGLGVKLTAEQWYLGLLTVIEEQLMLVTDVVGWWQSLAYLGMTQRLTRFFQEILLVEVEAPVVVFVDEIDSTLSLDFTDDFFAAIRYLYVARASLPEFDRLSFVLIGVATPGDLIRDPKRTPFNIGQRVDLTDFTFEEALPLAAGLRLATDESHKVLRWVLKWTGGHPYLTQRLCSIMTAQGRSSWTEADVDRVVNSTFFGRNSEQDNNLQFVRDMLTKRAPDRVGVLTTYRQVRRGKRPVPDEEQSLVKSHLKLSGVVRRQNAALQVRNLIYREVFDSKWLREHLPDIWWERIKPALPLIAASVAVSVGMVGLTWYAWDRANAAEKALQESKRHLQEAKTAQQAEATQKGIAEQKRQEAEAALQQAQVARQDETKQKGIAEQKRQEAEAALQQAQVAQQAEATQKGIAEQKRQEAEGERNKAKQRQKEAEQQKRIAEKRRQETETAKTDAENQKKIAEQRGQEAEQQRQIALARQLAAQAEWTQQRADLLPRSVLLAAESMQRLLPTGVPLADADQALRGLTLLPYAVASLTHEGRVTAVAFSPDGKSLATASDDKTARVWDASSGQQLARLTHESFVTAVAFSPDGKSLATASNDKTARVWSASSGQQLARLTHESFVAAVAFSPDSKFLATASVDKTARVWSASSGKQLARLTHEDTVRAVAFSPDGKFLATASENIVQVQFVLPQDLIAEACRRLTRNLTIQEWEQYLGNEPYHRTCPNLPMPKDAKASKSSASMQQQPESGNLLVSLVIEKIEELQSLLGI